LVAEQMTFTPEAYAFSLAFVASMGTFIGGLLVCLLTLSGGKSTSSNSLIGVLQAASAGVMLYMVFLDLVPESIAKVGQKSTMIYFFIGVAIFAALEALVSGNHDHEVSSTATSPKIQDVASDNEEEEGSRRPGLRKRKPAADTKSPATRSKSRSAREKHDLKRMGFITFLALFIHNIPEGLGVYLAAMADQRLGLELAVAIMLHNIPEGMACAIPLWASTKSYSYVLGMTLLNGLAEPLGVIVGGFLLKDHMTKEILSQCLAVVAGIMACISLHELQPTAIIYAGKSNATIALFVGMFCTFIALEIVHSMLHNDHAH